MLGYVNTKTQAIAELVRSGQKDRAITQIDQLGEAARSSYADVREGILALRTSLGPGRTFLDALREYLEVWQEQSEVRAEIQVHPEGSILPPLEPRAELQLLRLVQEALANVRKHAAARSVRVRFTQAADSMEVVIADDGRGFDPGALRQAAMPRFGLATMRERAEAVGGVLVIDSNPGRGTTVTVQLPVGHVPFHAMDAGTDAHARADR